MLTRPEALAVVSKFIADMNSRRPPDDQVVICEEHTVECAFVFAFAYNSKKFVETSNPRDCAVWQRPDYCEQAHRGSQRMWDAPASASRDRRLRAEGRSRGLVRPS